MHRYNMTYHKGLNKGAVPRRDLEAVKSAICDVEKTGRRAMVLDDKVSV